MEERDLNCSEEKSYCPIMADFATKVTKIRDEDPNVGKIPSMKNR